MSASSSACSGARRNATPLPLVPCIPCPDCGKRVRWYESTTHLHNGWIFYKCVTHGKGCDFWHWELEYVTHLVQHNVLRGDVAVDAIGAAEDRREELNAVGEGDGRLASNSRPRGSNLMSIKQAHELIELGSQLVLLMKMLLGLVLMMAVVGVLFYLKK